MAVVKFPNGGYLNNGNGDDYLRSGALKGDDGDIPDPYGSQPGGNQRRQTQKSADKKRTRRRMLRVFIVMGIIAALLAAASLQTETKTYTSASYTTIQDLPEGSDQSYLPFGGNILAYSRDGASCLNQKWESLGMITFEMQQLVLAVNNTMAAFCDYNGSTIYLIKNDGTTGSIVTNQPVRALTVSDSGEVAASMEDGTGTRVVIYQFDGTQISDSRFSLQQTGYPVCTAVSPDGHLFAVSHLLTGTTLTSSIAFHNFGNVGQSYKNHEVAGYNFDGEIFPYVRYATNDTCIAVSNGRLAYFKGNEIPENTVNVLLQDEVQGIYASDKYIGLLMPDSSGASAYSLNLYDMDGKEAGKVSFSLEYTDIQITGNRVIVRSDQKLQIYSIGGSQRFNGNFHDDVKALIPTGSANKFIIVTEKAVSQMVLE